MVRRPSSPDRQQPPTGNHRSNRRPVARDRPRVASGLLGNAAYTAARAERSSRRLVTARLVQDAGPPVVIPGAPIAAPPHAPAEWTTLDGRQYTGLVRAAPYQPAGTAVTIWGDTTGQPTRAPADHGEAVTRALLLVGLAAFGFAVGLLARLTGAADRRCRYAAIDREWAQVEPEWTGGR